MKIGIDFDNTIVCYDKAIAVLANEMLDLPAKLPRTKLCLRDYLRSVGREGEWTEFQGTLYGPGMALAEVFDGAIEAMQTLLEQGHELTIVSHRSIRPYAGTPHDLHASARWWVSQQLQTAGLFTRQSADRDCINFMETRNDKIAKIRQLGCQIFIDDLPEVLEDPGFPEKTFGVLFSPYIARKDTADYQVVSSWQEFTQLSRRLT
jgi:hypothetical protein